MSASSFSDLDAHIEAVVASWPELTPTQLGRLAAIISCGAGSRGIEMGLVA